MQWKVLQQCTRMSRMNDRQMLALGGLRQAKPLAHCRHQLTSPIKQAYLQSGHKVWSVWYEPMLLASLYTVWSVTGSQLHGHTLKYSAESHMSGCVAYLCTGYLTACVEQ